MNEAERDVIVLATAQWGVFTRAQALELGLPEATPSRRVREGRWEMVQPRVYRIAGTRGSFRQRAMAATLWAGPGSVISGAAAGRLWGLDDIRTSQIEVSVTRDRNRRAIPGIAVRAVRTLARPDTSELEGIPVTSLARTVIDLAQTCDPATLEVAIDAALRTGRTSPTAILLRAKAVGPRGRRGTGTLRALLWERRAGRVASGSALETRVRRMLINAALPLPVSQYRIHDRGRHVARADFAYPEALLVVEVKGYRWRSGRAAWLSDAIRDGEIAARGFRVVTITWDEVRFAPERAVDRVRRALGRLAA